VALQFALLALSQLADSQVRLAHEVKQTRPLTLVNRQSSAGRHVVVCLLRGAGWPWHLLQKHPAHSFAFSSCVPTAVVMGAAETGSSPGGLLC